MLLLTLLLPILSPYVRAEDSLPREIRSAAPDAAELLPDRDGPYGVERFAQGVQDLLAAGRRQVRGILRQRLRGIAAVLLSVILCGAVRGACPEGEGAGLAVSLAGALSVTALSAGSLEDLIGLGWKTIGELNDFARVLLPTLAAASAASGAVTGASVLRVTAVFLAEALLNLMDGVLLPLVYLYIGTLTASCALPGNPLGLLAESLKKLASGLLTASLLLFTLYLSVTGILSGPADAAAVKVARSAVAHTVPVVGGILADATEAVLAGAAVLRNAVGVFGLLAVLSACVVPFLHLGIQYLLYKGAAILASAVGMPELCRLIDGLGSAFALVLGMTGGCALLLLVSVLSFVAAAAP